MANTSYVTIVDADAYLLNESDTTAWDLLTNDNKQVALDFGRAYLDKNYSCTEILNPAQDVIQHANALFGNYYAQGILFDKVADAGLTKEKVSAQSGTYTEAEYNLSYVDNDQFIKATALLYGECSLQTNSIMAKLVRIE